MRWPFALDLLAVLVCEDPFVGGGKSSSPTGRGMLKPELVEAFHAHREAGSRDQIYYHPLSGILLALT